MRSGSDEVHGRNQDGRRPVREIASAEVHGLQIDPLDLAVAGLGYRREATAPRCSVKFF